MDVVNIEPQLVQNIQTAGLASGYQITNITIAGALAVSDAGGYLLVVGTTFPVPLTQSSLQIRPGVVPVEVELAEGYKAMAAENIGLAEEFLPAALEEWPMWEA